MSPRYRSPKEERGFSLLEVLLAVVITIVVMVLVARTMRHAGDVYQAQTDSAEDSSEILRALDDVTLELSRAGQGLGEGVAAVLARVDDSGPSSSLLTVRSNPGAVAARVLSEWSGSFEDVRVSNAESLEEGNLVLVVGASGRAERAEVAAVGAGTARLRSLETPDGEVDPVFPPVGTRILGLREVRYFLESRDDGAATGLVKDVVGLGRRVLATNVSSLEMEYLSADGAPIATAKAGSSPDLAVVGVALEYDSGPGRLQPARLRTAVALRPASATVDFERRDVGFRLARILYPIDHPVAVASRPGADWAAVLAAGTSPTQDAASLHTFETEKRFLSASVGDIVRLEDVRSPVAMAFAPESGPLAGSLVVAAWGLRIGHLTRLAPDANGRLSSTSRAIPFEGTEAVAQAGGIAFGVDGALYVTSREKGAIFRFRFDSSGMPSRPERLFDVPGTPGALAEGRDGHLYFVLNREGRGSLWRIRFDETLAPVAPVRVGELPGHAVSLAMDPVGGSLFALVRTRPEDFHVLELSARWTRAGVDGEEEEPEAPEPLFSLGEWQTRLEEGRVEPRELPFPPQELPARMEALRTETLDFLSFDAGGSLYVGAGEENLVLKFDLDRPSGRYAVGVAASVVSDDESGEPIVRIHAWKKAGSSR